MTLYPAVFKMSSPPASVPGLSAHDAGQFLRARRLELGLKQEQVVEMAGISSTKYLSAFENGRYHIANSEHFPALARVLRLTEAEVKRIKPDAFVVIGDHQPTPLTPVPPAHPSFSRFLSSMSDENPELNDPAVQQKLLSTYGFTGPSETVTAWLELYLFLKKRGLFEKKPN